jgi:hypothetical protein
LFERGVRVVSRFGALQRYTRLRLSADQLRRLRHPRHAAIAQHARLRRRRCGHNHIVYPPGQGHWGPDAKITRPEDQNTFVYAEADIADAYVNNDGVTNSVLSALRTFVYLRPNLVFVHDEMQVANPAVKKIFNVNFNAASVPRSGDVFSAVNGSSKLFMRALVPANCPSKKRAAERPSLYK